MINKDPIITAKIHYLRSILKEFAVTERHNKNVFKNNFRVMQKYDDQGSWFGDTRNWTPEQKDEIKTYLDNSYNTDSITALHVYYLKLKGVNKQHTKDDKAYESNSIYASTVKGFEEEFVVLQQAGKEGHYVS